MLRRIYLAGSLRNPTIPAIGKQLRAAGHEVFDGWYLDGVGANELPETIASAHFRRDFNHMQWANTGVLVLPSGKSAHLELGYMLGLGKAGYVLFDQPPERWDLMYRLAHGLFFNINDLIGAL